MQSSRSTVRTAALGTLWIAAVAPAAWAQGDSVIVLRGGRASTPAAPWAYDRPLGTLPDWLSPDECGRLVRFRDGELYRATRSAASRIAINAEAEVDMSRLHAELARTLTITDLLGARAAAYEALVETKRTVERALNLAAFLATPTGAPKTVAEIVVDIARKGGAAGADAIAEGKVDEYRRRLNAASQDLEGALRKLIDESELVRHVKSIEEVRTEMHQIGAVRLPEIERKIEAYRAAARAANRDLEGANAELSAIDATLRRACR